MKMLRINFFFRVDYHYLSGNILLYPVTFLLTYNEEVSTFALATEGCLKHLKNVGKTYF